jgi:hypothetical protein
MYGTRVKSPMQKLLYHLSFDNLAALCAIMTLASRHIDSLQGIRESSRSLRHMTAALRAVNDMLGKGPSACNDATIFAVTLLATVEVSTRSQVQLLYSLLSAAATGQCTDL